MGREERKSASRRPVKKSKEREDAACIMPVFFLSWFLVPLLPLLLWNARSTIRCTLTASCTHCMHVGMPVCIVRGLNSLLKRRRRLFSVMPLIEMILSFNLIRLMLSTPHIRWHPLLSPRHRHHRPSSSSSCS